VAIVKNITDDTLSLFTTDAPPCAAGDTVFVSDAKFVDRAWPKSTWEVVEPPTLDGYSEQSLPDAYLWVPTPDVPESPAKPARGGK